MELSLTFKNHKSQYYVNYSTQTNYVQGNALNHMHYENKGPPKVKLRWANSGKEHKAKWGERERAKVAIIP
jgi:hypothetical protein